MNMIIGRRQIVLTVLVLALGVAIYLNWQFSKTGEDLELTAVLSSSKNYGDAQYVNKNSNTSSSKPVDDYFEQAKNTRSRTRQEAINILKEVTTNAKVSAEDKTKAVLATAAIAKSVEHEGRIENLLKAKGFNECLATIDEQNASIVVRANKLTESQVAQIKDIVMSVTGFTPDKIKIAEVN